VVCGRRRAIDHRAPHRLSPNKPYLPEELARLGVLMWKLDPAARKTDPKLAAILKVRGYTYWDKITVSPCKVPGYEDKTAAFYKEHVHRRGGPVLRRQRRPL